MVEVIVTKENFQKEIMESDKPVLVDFWASWCGPCQMMGSVVAEIAEENPDIKVCKINVDEEQELAMQFNVMSIPFFAAFKNGALVNSTIGAQPKESLLQIIK